MKNKLKDTLVTLLVLAFVTTLAVILMFTTNEPIPEKGVGIDLIETRRLPAADEIEIKASDESVGKWRSLGEFKITHYGIDCVGCGNTTKTGTVPTENKTIAVDPDLIPLGSEVMINGKVYIAEDIGGAIQGNVIDMYVGTEARSNELGIYYTEIYIKEQ